MRQIKEELIHYGKKAARHELVAGNGGNISVRDGNIVWIKPAGTAMDDIDANDLCGLDLRSSEQISGSCTPSSETLMHLEIYRQRPDTYCVLHAHPPWITGVISAGIDFKHLIVDFVSDIGNTAVLPFLLPATHVYAKAVGEAIKKADTIFMINNGVLAIGTAPCEAYQRCIAAEHSAKAIVAASLIGKPLFFRQEQLDEINASNMTKRLHSQNKTNPS